MNQIQYNRLFKEFYQVLKDKSGPTFQTIHKLISAVENLDEFEGKYKNNMEKYRKQCQKAAERNMDVQ